VSNNKWHIKFAGQCLRQIGLARARWANKHNIGLANFNIFQLGKVYIGAKSLAHRCFDIFFGMDALIVVIYCNGQSSFGTILANYVLIKVSVYFLRGGQRELFALGELGKVDFDNLVAQLDALIPTVDAWASAELSYLFLGFTTRRKLQQISRLSAASHIFSVC